ncbi:MAG TPA: sigma-70 family RNA polymerase sigma factor [Solirubrobacteraceae bacterium]|nr:sigma-70 family RNA polymerase sigma factor [Solirubrobacteraceae bacterium]
MEAGTVPRIAAPRIPIPGPRLIRLASDARLVTLVREGRTGAFDAVYDRHHRGILSFCRHMLGDQHEAEDALQHTFMAAYSSLLSSRQAIQLRPWLFAIARNRCYSVLRSQRERPTAELDEPVTDGLAAEVQRRQDLRDLVSDLNRLPDEQRAAIVLAELESLSHAEIGEVLGVPRDKVKALVFQARESLLASRTARDTSCHEIREELAIGRGAALRRGNLRRHLRDCEGCRAYRAQVQRQRRQFGLLLPIGPTILAKEGLLAAAVGAGGAAAVGGSGLIASSALKTGVLKGIAAAVIAGVGTLGTVVVSASDLPVRAFEAGASGHPHAVRPAGGSVTRSRHASSTGASGASVAAVQVQSPDAVSSRTTVTRVAGHHGRAETGRQRSATGDRHTGGHDHSAPATLGNGGGAPGHSAGRLPSGLGHRSLANLPPGQAKKLAQAVAPRVTHAAMTPRAQAQVSQPRVTPTRHAAGAPHGHAWGHQAAQVWPHAGSPGHAHTWSTRPHGPGLKHAVSAAAKHGRGHGHR